MPHSTTGTTSYVLTKYSRAYPTKRTVQITQGSSELGSEWQHFTNPTIRLVLDVTRSKENIESVRLRILWQINNDPDAGHNSQPDVVFEDLDLLSFSLDLASLSAQKQTLEGLPLKAVYRDTVVGIRYLHPRDAGGEGAMYRRFQISFQSNNEASEFVDSIKPVCPCKMNPTPVPTNLNLRPQIISRPTNAISTVIQSARTPVTRTDQNPRVVYPSASSQRLPGPPEVANRLQPIMDTSSLYALSSSPPRHQVQSQINSALPRSQHQGNGTGPEATNLPPSSLPISSAGSFCGSTQRPGADAVGKPDATVHQDPIQSILASLSDDATSIYDLPTSTLERIVGEVIREEGFLQLVDRLSEMFTLRKVANV